MADPKISAAFVDAIINGMGWSFPLAYENRDFPASEKAGEWGRLTNVPTANTPRTLGDAGQDLFEGYYQVEVFAPENTGSGALLARAAQLREYFKAGRYLYRDGQEIKVRKVEPSQIRRPESGGQAQIAVFIYWSAWVPRDPDSVFPPAPINPWTDWPDFSGLLDNQLT